MGPLLGAALSFGSSLISGLFGRSGAKKRANEEKAAIDAANKANQQNADYMNAYISERAGKASRVPIVTKSSSWGDGNLKGMVTDAIANGFNPLTVLRSGGQGYYAKSGSTSSVTGSTAMDAALAPQHMATVQPLISQTQVPSTGEVIGGAIQSGVGTLTNMMATVDAQNFQREIVGMQLAGANANSRSNAGFSRSFSVPSMQSSGPMVQNRGGELSEAGGRSVWSDMLSPFTSGSGVLGKNKAPPQSTKDPSYYTVLGMKIYHDPNTSGAAVLEDRYGDDISKVTGPLVGGADLIYNLRFNPAFSSVVGALKYSPGNPFAATFAGKDIASYLLTGNWSGHGVANVPQSMPAFGGGSPSYVPRNVAR